MDANTWTLEKLFDAPIRYLVPLYQRPYVWSRSRQWEPLWADLRGLAERWLGNAQQDLNADTETSPHFLGAVVLEQIPNATGTLELRNVIDGQQRLTTLQLVLDAIESVVAEHGDSDDSALLKDLILNTKKVKHSDEQFKVWPTNVDRAAFAAAMNDDAEVAPHADSNLVQCHAFFRDAATTWALEEGATDAVQRLHALTVAMLGRVQIVVIDLDEGDNPQVIFETLNDRGEPLLAGDLVKNEILRRVMREDGETAMEECYAKTWKQFDTDRFWRTETKQGRFKRPRLDVLLFHWLTLRASQLASVGQEFLAFRRYVAANDLAIGDVAEDLHRTAGTWRRLEEEPRTTELGMSLNRLNVLDAGALRPLTLFLFNDAELTDDERLDALRIVESWAVRRAICKVPSMGMNRFVVDLVGRLMKAPVGTMVETLRNDLAGQTATVALWPTDTQVLDTLIELPLYNRVSQARVRLVLEALENVRRSKKTEEPAPEGLSIEHVLPGGWTPEAWPLPTNDPNGEVRRRMIDTLGNLTLLTGSLNSSQSNQSWPAKRAGLKQSVLRLNREFDDIAAWTEDEADERGKRLASEVLEIWPRPPDVPPIAPTTQATTPDSDSPTEFDNPLRPPTASESKRADELASDSRWENVAAVLTTWGRIVFGENALSNAGASWGLTALPGGGRLATIHAGGRDAVTIREDGSVELLAASPLPGASDSSAGADGEEEALCEFGNIQSALTSLEDEFTRSELRAWSNGLPIGLIPMGYSNPALVDALRSWGPGTQGEQPSPAPDDPS